MVSFDFALRIVLSKARQLPGETTALKASVDRVTARNIRARISLPPFDNSAMDGYALRSRDTRRASEKNPMALSLVGEVPAGRALSRRLKRGQTARIMTGAPLPKGADAVVQIEEAREREGRVFFKEAVEPGRNVRRKGEDVPAGQILLPAGARIGPKEVALLAASGYAEIPVIRRPVLGLLTTGNELVRPGKSLAQGKVYNANLFGLSAAARKHGGVVRTLGVAKDSLQDLIPGIQRGLREWDLLLTSGGVSVGKHDLVREALLRSGVKIAFTSVAMKPGKPMTFGTKGVKLVFGLPGNPVSALLSFELFVAPCLAKMAGRTDPRPADRAFLLTPVTKKSGVRVFLKGVAEKKQGRIYVRSAGNQSSGVLSSLAKANCLIMLPEKISQAKAGDAVEIRWL